jgi:cyclopropane fatty-acyl-phospholipid synthase-like methyltransferase
VHRALTPFSTRSSARVDHDKPWYEQWFDRAEYDIVYRHRDEADARKLLELILRETGLESGSRVLDMACGRGRHVRFLAEAGYRVTGVDLSENAIAVAKEMARSTGLDIQFEVGDMRDPVCDQCFAMVVNLFTSFGYFTQDEENAQAVLAMAKSLETGGWLVQDFMNGRYWRANLVPFDEREQGGLLIQQRRWIEGGRLNKEITLADPGAEERRYTESVRLFSLDDFERMYESAGLSILQVFGDSDGSSFGEDSRRLIIFANRR